MNNFQLTYSAFLFPAIPLMMLTFGNRWISISQLIRKMHSDFLDRKKNRSESASKYLAQIKILSLRLKYVRYMQLFSGLAFLFNLFTILIGIFNNKIPPYLFLLALVFLSFSLCVFLIEINLSSHALKTHLEDLEDKKKLKER